MDSKQENYSRGYTILGKYHFRSIIPRGKTARVFIYQGPEKLSGLPRNIPLVP